jgi:hypothetical protein
MEVGLLRKRNFSTFVNSNLAYTVVDQGKEVIY